ncbi:MAG: small-conductance mechanosensitive channel MscS [Enterobacteriaceae bacterium]
MEQLDLAKDVSKLAGWLQNNQQLLLEYAVNIVAAMVILIVGAFIARMLANGVNRLMQARGVDSTISHFLAMLLRYTILAFTLLAVLGRLGVQTTSIIAVMGAAGLAIGLALQGSLANFAAGVLLVVFRPIKVGELIQVGAITGTVDSVQIFSTTLTTGDNKVVIIPNGKVISGEIINFSRQPQRRVDLLIGVSYNADIEIVKSVLNNVIAQDARILQDKGVTIRLSELADSAMNFVVRVWVNTDEYWAVYYDLLENIKKALDANRIDIPYPQMDVRVVSSQQMRM